MTSRLLKTAERMEWERIKAETPKPAQPNRKPKDAMLDKEDEAIRDYRVGRARRGYL